MKSFVCLLALFAVSFAIVLPPKPKVHKPSKLDDITDHFKCLLCQDVAKDTEKWVGDEEESQEAKQIKMCEDMLGGSDNVVAQLVCDDFVKNELDDLIKHLESPEAEGQDALEACQAVGMCKSSKH